MMFGLNPFLFYLAMGVALIAIELLVFQLSVFWLLFIGFGALCAAVVAWVAPEAGWPVITGVFVIASGLISLVLYKPLKNIQSKSGSIAGNDAIGQTAEVLSPIATGKPGKVLWSGTDWKALLADGSDPLVDGDAAEIVGMEGITLSVKKKSV